MLFVFGTCFLDDPKLKPVSYDPILKDGVLIYGHNMDIGLLNKIKGKHLKSLKNLNVSHEKLFICFSAIPGSGKTYISKLIEEKYKAVRVNNDELRIIIKELIPGKSREMQDKRQEILLEYLFWFLKNYSYKNGLVILDSGIDRTYNNINEIANEGGFAIFIIKIVISKEASENRVKLRGNYDRNFIGNIDRWIRENKEFSKKIKEDVVIDNNHSLNLEEVFEKINERIIG